MIAPLRMVIATDISDSLHQEAAAESYIEEFRKENAEHLSFEDGAFAFCLCKAAYHHLPRLMIGVYEMLRVANLRVALIEPNDTYFPSNFLIHAFTVLKNFGRRLLGRQVERHAFEEAWNYCCCPSRREVEKLALGMGLRWIAFCGVNDTYIPGSKTELVSEDGPIFRRTRRGVALRNLLCRTGIMDYKLLSSMIFVSASSTPHEATVGGSLSDVALPRNSYSGE
jgi:hypothetical protein